MLEALTLLLLYQLAGEALVRFIGLPVPGPVLGMVLLCGWLWWRGVPPALASLSQTLLGHLSLLFVPAGVGVMLHARRLAAEWPALLVALLISTWLAVAVTALVMQATLALLERRRRD